MTATEARLKAGEMIEARGWCTGSFDRPSGAVCIVGAINRTHKDGLNSLTTRWALKDMGFADWSDAAQWNDAPGRTKAQVISKLREGLQ